MALDILPTPCLTIATVCGGNYTPSATLTVEERNAALSEGVPDGYATVYAWYALAEPAAYELALGMPEIFAEDCAALAELTEGLALPRVLVASPPAHPDAATYAYPMAAVLMHYNA